MNTCEVLHGTADTSSALRASEVTLSASPSQRSQNALGFHAAAAAVLEGHWTLECGLVSFPPLAGSVGDGGRASKVLAPGEFLQRCCCPWWENGREGPAQGLCSVFFTCVRLLVLRD